MMMMMMYLVADCHSDVSCPSPWERMSWLLNEWQIHELTVHTARQMLCSRIVRVAEVHD